MKLIFHLLWLLFLGLLMVHGAIAVYREWRGRTILKEGKIVEVIIRQLDCEENRMTFQFENSSFQKKIDSRDCALFNKNQKLKLKYSETYPGIFLFANEYRPNLLMLGALEIILAVLGLIANLPLAQSRNRDH